MVEEEEDELDLEDDMDDKEDDNGDMPGRPDLIENALASDMLRDLECFCCLLWRCLLLPFNGS